MNNKKVLMGICVVVFIIMCAIFARDNKNIENNEIQNQVETNNETKEELDIIYKDDEVINEFLNKYNKLYSEEIIESKMISVYHHHGSDHKDQVQFILEGLQIILTDELKDSKKISVYIKNESNSSNDITLRKIIKKFVKVYNPELTDQQIEDHLKKQDSAIQIYENIEYWMNRNINNNVIEYIKLTGTIN